MNERARLEALRACKILDTEAETHFDDLVALATHICGTSIALVSLVDEERQWFKARFGLDPCETSREVAFCAHAILDPGRVFVVEDATTDERFSDNPLVTGEPHVRFYAGAPLVDPDGYALGTLCVIDQEPRRLDDDARMALTRLARQVVFQLELRRTASRLRTITQALAHTNREFDEFQRCAARAFDQPLGALSVALRGLEEAFGADAAAGARAALGEVGDAVRLLERLAGDLRLLSQTGSDALEITDVDLAECARQARTKLTARLQAKGGTVTIESMPHVHGDRRLLSLLYEHLIANALAFADDAPPEVRVGCDTESGEIVFCVNDNGRGINGADSERIFLPFERLRTAALDVESTGVGLTLCRKVVERHGGRLWVERAEGGGSRFRFRLPLARAAAS